MKPTYKEKYPHLFEPLVAGKNKVVFNNRVFLAPVGAGPTGGGADNGRMNLIGVDFYTEHIRGGFASVCLPLMIPYGSSLDGVYVLGREVNYMNMHLMQRSIHAYRGRSFAEIGHGGPVITNPDMTPLGADTRMYNGRLVKGMDEKDMEETAQLFANEAKLCRRAGFDGILLHFAHGVLFNDFLSPLSNHRTDEYGGSVENRCRFPIRVLKAIREAVGDDLLIELRLNGNDEMPGGIVPEDAAEQVMIFQDYVDLIHISCGTRLDASSRPKMHPTSFTPYAHNAYASEIVKKKNPKIPIGVVGSIYSPAIAEEVLAKGQADYVLMARSGLADPEIIKKAKEGREEDIRPCLRCCYCIDHGRRKAKTTGKELKMADEVTLDRRCAVNPLFCQGATKKRIPLPERSKNVAVIGGGVAGMQAALSAADRGHHVVLYEKTDKLGGQALLSDVMWFKKEMKLFHEYLENQVRKNPNIYIMFNTEADFQMISDSDPDAVIVAVGAEQVVPNIPGVEKAIMSFDVFGHEDRLGKRVVIVGGGSVGCELSIHLSGLGHECTVIELTNFLAGNAQLTPRMSILEHMEKNNVQSFLNTQVVAIEDNGVTIEDAQGQRSFVEADSVIISVGTRAKAALRDSFKDVAFDVINVGDCLKASDIVNAVETGFDAGLTL